jgi:hypothetical protein
VVVARGGARLELLAGPRGDDPARQAQAGDQHRQVRRV